MRDPRWVNFQNRRVLCGPASIGISEMTRGHVYLDGEDVTKDCFYADESKGEVQHYFRGDGGGYEYDREADVIKTCPVRCGKVEIRIDGDGVAS